MSASSPSLYRRSHPAEHFDTRPSWEPSLPSTTPPRPPPPRRGRGAGRFALGLAAGLGLSVVFVASFAAALLLHLNAPSARRAIARIATDAASSPFRGRIEVGAIDHISLHALDIHELTLRDPAGRAIASAHGAHARFDALELARAFLAKAGATPTIDRIAIERLEVALIPNEQGVPTFADTFEPRDAAPSKGPAEEPPSTFRLALPSIDAHEIEVAGVVNGTPIDATGAIERLGVYVSPEGTRLDVLHVGLEAALPVAAHVDVHGSARFPPYPAPDSLGVILDARVDVQSSGAHASIEAGTDGRSFDARVEVSQLTPDAVEALTGAPPPIPVPVSLALDARGDRHFVSAFGNVRVGDALAMVDGVLDVDALAGRAAIGLRGVDPATLVPGAPSLGLSSDLTAEAMRTERGVEVRVDGGGSATLDGHAAALDIDAKALIANANTIDASGKVSGKLGRSDAAVTFDLHKHGTAGTAHAELTASSSALEELHAFHGQPLRGRIDVSGAADIDLGAETIAMTARAHAIGLSHPKVAVPDGVVSLDVDGPLSKPTFTAGIVAPQLVLAPSVANPHRLYGVDVRATGTPDLVAVVGKLGTDAGQHVELSTHIAPTSTGGRIAGTRLRLTRNAFAAELTVRELTLDSGALTVQGLRLSSTAGGLRLDGAFDPKRHHMTVDVASTPLDLPALAYGAGVESQGISGTLAINAKLATITVDRKKLEIETPSSILQLDPNKPAKTAKTAVTTAPYVTGHLKLDLVHGTLPSIGDVETHVDVEVEDRLVAGDVRFGVSDIARVFVHGAALVPGRLDDPHAWRDATVHGDLRIPNVDLEKVSAYLAKRAKPGTMPTQFAGIVNVVGHIERRDEDGPPTGFLNIDTKGLAMQSGTTRIDGIDLRVRAGAEGVDDDEGKPRRDAPLTIFGVVEARDAQGPLAIIHAGTEGTIAQLKRADGALADLPFVLNVIVPPRDVERMPRGVVRKAPFHGKVAVAGHGGGTLGAPKIELRARVEDIVANSGVLHDAEVTLTYDGAIAKFGASLTGRNGVTPKLLAVDGELRLRALDVISGGKIPWTAKLDAKFDGMPLDVIAIDTGITGALRGELHVDHLNDPNAKAATIDGRIDIVDLRVGEALFEDSNVVVKVDEHAATATIRMHGKDGALDAHANVPLTWASAASPAVAPGAYVDASLEAKNFRLKVLEPFIEPLDALDGRLDGRVVAHLKRKAHPDKEGAWEGAPEGTITLRDGVIVADVVGERWDHVSADVKFANGRVDLPKLELRGRRKGRATLKGYATLDGIVPKTFHVDIDAKRFSFAQEGVRVGDASGKIVVEGKRVILKSGQKEMLIDATLDPLTIDLAAEAGKQVQQLGNDPSIIVAQPIGPPPKPPEPPGTGMAVKLVLHIPRQVTVRRDDMRIAASGNPAIAIDGNVVISGEVRIDGNVASQLRQRSWIDVAGKRFFIQQSRIAFLGSEEIDPQLDIEARWQAPDRTIVQVKVTGHISNPKLTFKALDESGSPLGYTQGEVMSLLVLGRRDAGSAQQQREAEKGATSQTASLVSGMTGAIIGAQLQRVLPSSVSLSLAPGRYSGGFQTRNIYFEVAYNAAGARMGPQAIGQTTPRTTFGIEWRFARMWSLMTTIGDTGSALVDLLWHYRY